MTNQPTRHDGAEQDVETLAEAFRAAHRERYAVVIPEMDPEWAAEIVLASDWLAARERRAGAAALREAADDLAWVRPEVSPCAPNFEDCCGSEECCDAMRPITRVASPAWLRARAERLEAGE